MKTRIDRSTTPPTLIVIDETRIKLTPMRNFYDAEARVKARGSHYFDADTIRFFRARYHGSTGLTDGSVLIVESTKRTGFAAPDGMREYRVIRVTIEGEIMRYGRDPINPTIYARAEGARKAMYRIANAFEAASVKARKTPEVGGN